MHATLRQYRTSPSTIRYTPKSNTRKRIPGTKRTDIVVCCTRFRTVSRVAAAPKPPAVTQTLHIYCKRRSPDCKDVTPDSAFPFSRHQGMPRDFMEC
eukprot:863279-Rhodomonas_salina.4